MEASYPVVGAPYCSASVKIGEIPSPRLFAGRGTAPFSATRGTSAAPPSHRGARAETILASARSVGVNGEPRR
jgi:hypothetical protein